MQSFLGKLMHSEDLTENEASEAAEIMTKFDDSKLSSDAEMRALSMQISAFLCLLRVKQETEAELTGIARTLLKHATHVDIMEKVVDITGTGGDGANTVNISTGATILAAACGVPMAKHGNRATSSTCGSADVLEELGINIDLPGDAVARCIRDVKVGFMFAPNFHPAMRSLRTIRQCLSVPTVFNTIGPLIHPAGAHHRVLGVNKKELLRPMAAVGLIRALSQTFFQLQRVKAVAAIQGSSWRIVQGLDELAPLGKAHMIEITSSRELEETVFDPQDYQYPPCTLADIQGGTRQQNAELLRRAFRGEPGPIADALSMNAAMALYVYGKKPTLRECICDAKEVLRSGVGLIKIAEWGTLSQSIRSGPR